MISDKFDFIVCKVLFAAVSVQTDCVQQRKPWEQVLENINFF